MNPYEPCRDDGLCSECADAPPSCENCGNGLDDNRIVDETDPGIVYCSPECRAEFVAAAEGDEGAVHTSDEYGDDGMGVLGQVTQVRP